MDVDVVVVGGGPTGLLLAGELRLGGAEVIVLERLAAPTGLSKALGVVGRGAQTLHNRGLLDRFDDAATAGARFARFAHVGGIPLDLGPLLDRLPPGQIPPTLMTPQARVEQVLEQWAGELGAQVRRGHEVTTVDQTDDRVTLAVAGPDGPYRLTAEYVVGCDGARSLVRKRAGIGFPGTEATQISRFGDVTLADPATAPLGMHRTPTGLFTAVPLGNGVHRIVVSEWRTDGDRDAPVTLDDLRGAVRRVIGVELAMNEPRWLSRFTDAARQADRYRAGRILLAGDAAHIQLPAGGPGMTTGLQDAANLGWKLAAQIRGDAPEGLLDTYHAERHPVVERMLTFVRAQGLLLSPGPQVDALREVFAELLTEPASRRTIAERQLGLDIRYEPGDHPLIGGWAPNLTLGIDPALRETPLADPALADPTPTGTTPTGTTPTDTTAGDTTAGGTTPSDTTPSGTTLAGLMHRGRPVLLDLTADRRVADAAAEWRDRVDIVTATSDEPLAGLLVRPDGYVAWAHRDGDEGLRAALGAWFGPAMPPPGRDPRPTVHRRSE